MKNAHTHTRTYAHSSLLLGSSAWTRLRNLLFKLKRLGSSMEPDSEAESLSSWTTTDSIMTNDVHMDSLYLKQKIRNYLVVMYVNIIIRRQLRIPLRAFSWD